jgi:DNA-binding MarR family transcriptional regulator
LKITQFSVLRELALQSPLSISELAHRLDLDRTTMGRNLRVLAQDDFVSFAPGQDRREHTVQMTDKGSQAFAAACPLWEKAQNTITNTLGQEQINAFMNLLSTLETATT